MRIYITTHAVQRYLERCSPAERTVNTRIVRDRIMDMATSPDSMKFMAGGRILISGDWLLIQAENRIVTLYKGDERRIVRKKVRGKKNVQDLDTSTDGSGGPAVRTYSPRRLDRIKSLLRGEWKA